MYSTSADVEIRSEIGRLGCVGPDQKNQRSYLVFYLLVNTSVDVGEIFAEIVCAKRRHGWERETEAAGAGRQQHADLWELAEGPTECSLRVP